MKKSMFSLGTAAALALVCVPAAAQDATQDGEAAEMTEAMNAFSQMFEIEPLTPEQEARLPVARRLVEALMPEGSMRDMMAGALDGMFSPLTQMEADPAGALENALGYMVDTSEMDEADVIAALDIVDPAWRERQAAELAAAEGMMTRIGEVMEPIVRDVMAELYAIYFTQEQLEDIETFFGTETGAVFARESWSMSSDPRMMARVMGNEAMWATILDFESMGTLMEQAPQSRSYEDLRSEERARVMELTGISDEQLRYAISYVEVLPAEDAQAEAEEPVESPE